MEENNVHDTQPTNREDLKHTDTVSSTTGPDGGELDSAADEGGEGVEVANDPVSLGNDAPEDGDLVHVSPGNQPLGKMPGM